MRTQPGLALAFVCFLRSGRIHGFRIHPDLATVANPDVAECGMKMI